MYTNNMAFVLIDSNSSEVPILVDQTSKVLKIKLDRVSVADVHNRVYDFDVDSIYEEHYSILKFLLNNGYLTKNVLDFSQTVRLMTRQGGGCMYSILDVHKEFLDEVRKLVINFNCLENPEPPYLVPYIYLDEMKKYYTKKQEDNFKQVMRELNSINGNNRTHRYGLIGLLFDGVKHTMFKRDVPNYVYFAIILAFMKTY